MLAASQAPLLFWSCPGGFREGLEGDISPRARCWHHFQNIHWMHGRISSGGKGMDCEKQAEVSNSAPPSLTSFVASLLLRRGPLGRQIANGNR